MVTISLPEPLRDINAQIGAVLDPQNPKTACFVASGAKYPTPPKGVFMHEREEGTLYTTDQKKLDLFRRPVLLDRDMAVILDYPQTKSEVMQEGGSAIMQAQDQAGNIVQEFAIGMSKLLGDGMNHILPFVPKGGKLIITTVEKATSRRSKLVRKENTNG